METEKGVILVVYRGSHRSNRYALLKRKKNWEGWELPKGHLEEDDYQYTVKLELKEETGIEEEEILEVEEMNEETSWTYEQDGEKFKKEYRGYIVKVDESTNVDISQNPCDEHEQGFFLREEDAKSLLTYENNVEILEKGIELIKSE